MSSLSSVISLTTGIVILYVVFANLPVAFGVVFMLFLLSQGLLGWMIVRILQDKRTSAKTFESHFYEDVD